MKYLVTGGAGFIGSNLVRYLLQQHPTDHVVNLDLLTYAGNLENLADVEGDARYTFVKGDICDKALIMDLVQDVDVIINVAAESHVDRSIQDASPFIRTNVHGTQVLLDAAVAYGKKRFHQVSTDEVFGALDPEDAPFTEQTSYAPRNPYSAAKAGADHLVMSYFTTHGLPVTISNCSNNYGPWQFPEKCIPLFISKIKAGENVPLYGDGMHIRDWLFVEDHCSAIDLCVQKGKPGERYVFGDDNEISNLDLTKKLLSFLGGNEEQISFVTDRPGHDRRYATNSAKAKRDLGWKTSVAFEEGLQKTVAWYEANQDWVARCMSGAYQAYYKKQYQS